MPNTSGQSIKPSKHVQSGVVSHANDRAATKKELDAEHNIFLKHLINALSIIDGGFKEHEDALRSRYRDVYIFHLQSMQRWLRRTLKEVELNSGEPIACGAVTGGDDCSDVERLWAGVMVGLGAVDERFVRLELAVRETWDSVVKDILRDAQVWLRQHKRGRK